MERSIPLPPIDSLKRAPDGAQRARRHRRRRWRIQRVPWTVYGYIAGEVLRVFLLGIFAISLLYATLAAYQTVRSGVQMSFIWPLIFSTLAYPLYFSIPISLLFAVTLVVGRMVSELEVTALRTHGISPFHTYAPAIGLGAFLAIVSFYVNGWIIPGIHYDKRNLQSYLLKQLETLGSGVNRTILLPDGQGTLWVGSYRGPELRRVRVDIVPDKDSLSRSLREHLPSRLPGKVTIFANEGRIDFQEGGRSVVLDLKSVDVLIPEVVRGPSSANEVFHQTVSISGNVLIPLSFPPKSPGTKDRSTPDLLKHIRRLVEERDQLPSTEEPGLAFTSFNASREEIEKRKAATKRGLAAARTEFHRRLAFSISCLTFPLLGVSLSLILHRWSRLVPFFFGNLTVIGIYFPLLMVAVALGDRGFVPGFSLALPNLALLGLGAFLTRKVSKQ